MKRSSQTRKYCIEETQGRKTLHQEKEMPLWSSIHRLVRSSYIRTWYRTAKAKG